MHALVLTLIEAPKIGMYYYNNMSAAHAQFRYNYYLRAIVYRTHPAAIKSEAFSRVFSSKDFQSSVDTTSDIFNFSVRVRYIVTALVFSVFQLIFCFILCSASVENEDARLFDAPVLSRRRLLQLQ